MRQRNINIGMLGAGTVGSGVIKILQSPEFQEKLTDFRLRLTTLVVRDTTKPRDFILPEGVTVSDIHQDLQREDIDIVVEVAGGVTQAKEVVFAALRQGKGVATANKALLAYHLGEIRTLQEQYPESRLGFEAAVAGGIPIIGALSSHYIADRIQRVSGIINGTTNFMLTNMGLGADYNTVLKEAQKLGYAESDPTADVEGFDARSKLILLSNLAFGKDIPEQDIFQQGITQIDPIDFQYARLLGANIKLIASSQDTGTKVSAFVSPSVVSNKNSLAHVDGVFNSVQVESENLGVLPFTGPGAGSMPTATSVVADIVRLAQGNNTRLRADNPHKEFEANFQSKFYIRLIVQDEPKIIQDVASILGGKGISIDSIQQLPGQDKNELPFVILTEIIDIQSILACKAEIDALTCMRRPSLILPYMQ